MRVAHLGCAPADLSWRAGVDVLCFGGVKNGLAVGEAVLFFDRELAHEFEWRVKQAGHLNSKMRLVTAPWVACSRATFGCGTRATPTPWPRGCASASRARGRAPDGAGAGERRVRRNAGGGAGERCASEGWRFYTFLGETGCRLMCAWDTTPETVDRFAADMLAAASPSPRLRGEGRGEGRRHTPASPFIAAPHPSPLPTGSGERDAPRPTWPSDRPARRPASPWWRGQRHSHLAVRRRNLERAEPHADLLGADAEEAADAHHHALDLPALADDQVVDGADRLAILVDDLGADQPLLGQVLARRLALEEGVGGDGSRLGRVLLWVVLLLRQGRHGESGGEEERKREFLHVGSLLDG